MSITNTSRFAAHFKGEHLNYSLKCYIQDDNSKWVDFSDLVRDGADILKSLSQISYVSEKRDHTGITASRGASVEFYNKDDMFNGPVTGLKAIDGSDADFGLSQYKRQSVFYNREIQFRIAVVHADGGTEEAILATYRVGEISRGSKDSVSVDLKDKSLALRDEDSASIIKNGLDWYQNRSIPFLLRECLKDRYAQSDGTLPSTFTIPNKVEIQSAASIRGDSGEQRVLSHFGRQPEIDEDGNYIYRGNVVRAICCGPAPSSLGSQTSADKNYVYYGADNYLWVWDPATERSTLISIVSFSSDHVIRNLWYSTYTGNIYGIAWTYTFPFGVGGTENNASVTLFRITWSGGAFSVSLLSPTFSFNSGEYCYRAGYSDGSHRNINTENVPIVGTQLVYIANNITAYGKAFDGSNALFGAEGDLLQYNVPGTFNLNKGYCRFQKVSSTANTGLSFTFGQTGFVVYNERSATDQKLWYFVDGTGTSGGAIKRYDLLTGNIVTIIGSLTTTGGLAVRPTCGCASNTNDSIYLGGVGWNENSSSVDSVGVIYRISDAGVVRLWEATAADEKYLAPIDIEIESSGLTLIVSFFDRIKLFDANPYAIGQHSSLTVSNAISSLARTPGYIKGLIRGSVDNEVYGYESDTGKVVKYNTSSNTITYADDSFPAVDNEYGLSVQKLAVDVDTRSTDIVYGVSAPSSFPTESFTVTPDGKYYLWKYDTYYSGRIELFKTEGMSIFEAIDRLGNASNYKPGFDESGDFYFARRNDSVSSADYSIDFDALQEGNIKGLSITIESGEDEVYNVARVQFSTVFLSEPEIDVRLVARERAEEITTNDGDSNIDKKPFDSNVIVTQLDNRKKIIYCEVVTGGLISDGAAAIRYRTINQEFETRLKANYTAGATALYITTGIDSVKKGDTLKIYDADNSEEIEIASTPTITEKADDQLTLVTGGLSNGYNVANTIIEIRSNNNKWSDQINNFLKNPFFLLFSSGDADNWTDFTGLDTAPETTQNYYKYGNRGARLDTTAVDTNIRQEIAASKFETSTVYTFGADVLCFKGDGSVDASTVLLSVFAPGAIEEGLVTVSSTSTRWKRIEVSFTTKSSPSGNIGFYISVNSTSGTSKAWVDGAVVKKGRNANLDLIALSNNTPIAIGDTNVELYIEPAQEETEFVTGDRFIISCDGFDLKQDSFSVARSINVSSRATYGERSYPDVQNPFISRSMARDLSQLIISDNGYPKYRITVTIPFNPTIQLINSDGNIATVAIRSKRHFPNSPGWQELCYVLAKMHNPISRTTILTLIPKNQT